MKRMIPLVIVVVLALFALVLAGCDESTTETSATTMEDMTDGTEATMEDTDGDDGMDDGEALPQATPGAYTDLTPAQAKQLIDATPDLVIVDVSPVYADGHIPGAVNYYIGDGSLEAALPTLDKSVPYLVYCHVDSASIGGAELMVADGFPEVYRLEGNYAAWVAAGYPVEQ